MQPGELAYATPADAPDWQRWLVFSPAARIVFFTIAYIAVSQLLLPRPLAALGFTRHDASAAYRALGALLAEGGGTLLAYVALTAIIEHRRRPHELALRRLLPWTLAGLVTGALLFSVVTGVQWLLGVYHVSGTHPQVDWLPAVLQVGLAAGIGEEIIARGVLFRTIEEGLGTGWALAISALFFGAAHIYNPGATLWSSAAIAIEAGLMLGMLYHVTRSLWPCIGLHAAWNVMQGTVFGIPVSGTSADGWLVSYRTGPEWLSGGSFGSEASVIALIVCSLMTIALGLVAWRHHSFVAPSWRR